MPFPTYNQPGYFGQSYQSPQTMSPASPLYSQGFGGLQQQQAQQQQQATPVTNKIYVTSFEDAMNRFAQPNSIYIYVLQDETKIFEIATDSQGRKLAKTYDLKPFFQPTSENAEKANNYATKEDFRALEEKIKALESSIPKPDKKKIIGGKDYAE